MRDILVAMLVEKIELLLSTKGMNVQNVITLPTPLSERDSAFEEAVVAREFQGIHYYE